MAHLPILFEQFCQRMGKWREYALPFPLAASVLFLLSALAAAGCGYHVENGNPALAPGKVLAVESFQNQTSYYKIDQIFTRAMVNELVRATDYRIVADGSRADAVLQSSIKRLSAQPVTYSKSSFASTFMVTVNAGVTVTEKSTGEVLYQNQNLVFSEQYVINTDVENFFSEMNPALSRLANDFSSSVVASILEVY